MYDKLVLMVLACLRTSLCRIDLERALEETSLVVFYEPIPSAVRKIQRTGRTARTKPGKVVVLITKGTRDEAYHWTSYHKEKKMIGILRHIKSGQKDITDFGGTTD